jgi:hypothetical protein
LLDCALQLQLPMPVYGQLPAAGVQASPTVGFVAGQTSAAVHCHSRMPPMRAQRQLIPL